MCISKWGGQHSGGVTRISVSSNGNVFEVRRGNSPAVRVWSRNGSLQCDCRRPNCEHVESLMMCGFVEDAGERSKAA